MMTHQIDQQLEFALYLHETGKYAVHGSHMCVRDDAGGWRQLSVAEVEEMAEEWLLNRSLNRSSAS